jgi:lactoylglutathione lyase
MLPPTLYIYPNPLKSKMSSMYHLIRAFKGKGCRMKLNHINLAVTNVLETEKFLQTYFGLTSQRTEGDNQNMGFLFDDDGLVLTLMQASRRTELIYPGNFHIGFIQPSEAKVNEIYQRLKDDGYAVEPPQRSHGWTFYIQAPGGFTIEVVA